MKAPNRSIQKMRLLRLIQVKRTRDNDRLFENIHSIKDLIEAAMCQIGSAYKRNSLNN